MTDGDRTESVRNEITTSIGGHVVQAGTVNLHTGTKIGHPPELAEAASQLAHSVRSHWEREEEIRRIHDPFALPVRWHLAPDEVTDHWANICQTPPGDAAEPLGVDADQIADVYREVPSGRLVILGDAGSGKTILAIQLALGLMASLSDDDPVPVIVSLGSWNPSTTSLRDWLTDQLIRDHPGLDAAGRDRVSLAAKLVQGGYILPILDGFDEISDGQFSAALKALNATKLPMVLTSRVDEYTKAVRDSDVLTAAAAIVLDNLTVTDLANYLPRTSRAGRWDALVEHIRRNPNNVVAGVLATPLMVSLARSIYSDTPTGDPIALLEYRDPQELENHLLDAYVPALYENDEAQRWFGLIARHLVKHEKTDLAWWKLREMMPWWARALAVGFTCALVAICVEYAVISVASMCGVDFGNPHNNQGPTTTALILVLAFGLPCAGVTAIPISDLEPYRLQLRVRPFLSGWKEIWKARNILAGIVYGSMAWVSLFIYVFIGGNFSGGELYLTRPLEGLLIILGFYLIPVITSQVVINSFASPVEIEKAVSVAELLATDRRSAVFRIGAITIATAIIVNLFLINDIAFTRNIVGNIAAGIILGFPVGLAVGVSGSAWAQWLIVCRLWLPLFGKLPWRLNRFLDDGHRRGVLRQAGAVYQFRHVRLQDRLAGSG